MSDKPNFINCVFSGPDCWGPNEWMFVAAIAVPLIMGIVPPIRRWAWARVLRLFEPRIPPKLPPGVFPEHIVQGRDADLDSLKRELDDGKTVVIAPADAERRGGVGKSTLARYYIQTFGDKYHGVWWLTANEPGQIETGLAELASRVGLTFHDKTTGNEKAHAAIGHICDHGEQWLIVFDNANHPEDVTPWLPASPSVSTIVTSRHEDWPAALFDIQRIALLDADEPTSPAVKLLLQEANGYSKRPDGLEAATYLAGLLNGLPISLVRIGAVLRKNPTLGFAECLERVRETLADLPASDYAKPDAVPKVETATALIALQDLRRDPVGREAEALLRMFAFMAPDRLERRWITGMRQESKEHEFYKPIPREILALSKWWRQRRLRHALEALSGRFLIEGHGDATYSIHRLTQAVIRDQLGQEGRARWREAAASVLVAAYPSGKGGPLYREGWPLCAALTPHVQALAGHGADSAAAHYLYIQASGYLGEIRQDLPGLMLARAALRATKKLHRDDCLHRDVGEAYSEVGVHWINLGHPVIAEKLLARAVGIAEENPEIPDKEGAIWFNNHGAALRNLGRRAEAEGRDAEAVALLRRAVQRVQQALCLDRRRGDRHTVATRLNNLGLLRQAQGRHAAAVRLTRIVVRIHQEVFTPDDPLLAVGLYNLASVLLVTPDWREAEPLFSEARDILESAFAAYPRHPDRVNTANGLAIAALMRGDRAKAEAIIARYPDDLDLGKLERDALTSHIRIMTDSGKTGREALKQALDLMGLSGDDVRRILSELTQPPDPT